MKSENKIVRSLFIAVAFITTLVSCAGMETGDVETKPAKYTGTVFIFSETPPGGVASPVRMFINDYFIRIDEGESQDGYVLFDRKKQVIKSVVNETKTIFIIKKTKLDAKPPIKINYTVVKESSSALMKKRGGMKAFHHKYSANGKACYNTVSVKSYMPEAVQALKEFREVLAGEHSKTITSIPGEEHDACDLALNIFYAGKHLEAGFPVREWGEDGYQRFLGDVHQNITIPDELLSVPSDYQEFSVSR